MTKRSNPLLPDRHPQQDLFVCDIVDAVPKGDMGSMEHPVFSLATRPDMKTREYQNGETFIKISPSPKGLATVHDRDVLIYCISQCMAALNEGRPVQRKLKIKAHDLLVATNRQTSGRGYELLKDTLRRLQGTQIETNVKQGGKERFSVFSLIDRADVVRETRDGRMQDIEITLSEWVFDAIENNNVLTLSREYFRLRKPIERRLYDLARKHCGKQPRWDISLEKLAAKTGATSTAKEFKRMIHNVIKENQTNPYIPDYTFSYSDNIVTVRPIAQATTNDRLAYPLILRPETYEAARLHASGWDIRALEAEWRDWILYKGLSVRNPDAHFLKFCKTKGPYQNEELF